MFKELYSERLRLRKFRIENSQSMFENWASDPEVSKYVMWNAHNDVSETKKIINNWLKKYSDDKNPYIWAVWLDNLIIGSISVVELYSNNACEVGYCFGKKWWGKGLATESLKAVIGYLTTEENFSVIYARHIKENHHSGNVMKKAGMTKCISAPEKIKNFNDSKEIIYSYDTKKTGMFEYYSSVTSHFNSSDQIKVENLLETIDLKYSNEKNYIYKNYKDYITSTNSNEYNISRLKKKHKKLVIEVITECINYFKLELHKLPISIWLNGSFARSSNIYMSDIDLNFTYDNIFFEEMIYIEEVFGYILYSFFELDGRDNVHPMGYTKLSNNYIVSPSLIRRIENDSESIEYHLRDSSSEIMSEYLNLSRNAEDILSYFNSSVEKKDSEWLHCRRILFSEGQNIFEDFDYQYKMKVRNEFSTDYYNQKNVIIKSYQEYLNTNYDKNKSTVSDFKILYKDKVLSSFYELVLFYSKQDFILYNHPIKVEVSKFFNSKSLKKTLNKNSIIQLRKNYELYQKELMRIKYIFKLNRLEFSSHNYNLFPKTISEHYKHNFDEDLFFQINYIKNEFLTMCIETLKKGELKPNESRKQINNVIAHKTSKTY